MPAHFVGAWHHAVPLKFWDPTYAQMVYKAKNLQVDQTRCGITFTGFATFPSLGGALVVSDFSTTKKSNAISNVGLYIVGPAG